MAKKVIRVLLIAGSLFFAFGLFSIGLPMWIFAIVIVDLIVILLTGSKEKIIPAVEKTGKWSRDRIEILGTIGTQAAETAGVVIVKTAKAAGAGIKAGYKELGGTEGARKAAEELSTAAKEVFTVGAYATVKLTQAAVQAVQNVSKMLEEDRSKEQQGNLLEDAAKFVDFVVMKDD